jgi:hypothetical protein
MSTGRSIERLSSETIFTSNSTSTRYWASYWQVSTVDKFKERCPKVGVSEIWFAFYALPSARKSPTDIVIKLPREEIVYVCMAAREVLMSQPSLVELEAPVKICGDTHGQFYDLLRIYEYGGFPPEANYLFLGDYVDRGKHNIETAVLQLAFKWVQLLGDCQVN